MDEGPLPEVAAYVIRVVVPSVGRVVYNSIKTRQPAETAEGSGGERRIETEQAVVACEAQAIVSSLAVPELLNNSDSSQAVSELHNSLATPDAAEASADTAMATAAAPDSTGSQAAAAAAAATAGAEAVPAVRPPSLLNRTNSERLGQKPNQRKTFQEVLSIREEDRRVTETLVSENTEFETTLKLEEYALKSGKSLAESVQQHRHSRSAHIRHHEEVSSVDICRKRVEHVYRSNFLLPDKSSVGVTHQEVYHTTDPNVEVTVCLAQSLPSVNCPPGQANIADLAVGNQWASLLLSCDGFRDDQLCSMLLKKDGEHGAEAAAEAAAVASSVAAVVSLAAADSSPPVVDVSLSSEITHPLPTAYVKLYGEEEKTSTAESVVENVTASDAGTQISSASTSQKVSTIEEFPKQIKVTTQKDSTEAKEHVSEHPKKSSNTYVEDLQSNNSKTESSETVPSPKDSQKSSESVKPQNSRRRRNRVLQGSDSQSKVSDASSEATETLNASLQQRMEAFLNAKKPKSNAAQEAVESQSTKPELKKVTVLKEVKVASNDSLKVLGAPTQSTGLSISEKMCMEVLAQFYDPDLSDSDDDDSERPRGSYSYLCDEPKYRSKDDGACVRVFQRLRSNERRLTRGEILTVEFAVSTVDNSESLTATSSDAELDDTKIDHSRFHTVYVRDPASNSYVKVHEPIYDDVTPKGSKAPSESSSDSDSHDETIKAAEPVQDAMSQSSENSPLACSDQQSGTDQVDVRIAYPTQKTAGDHKASKLTIETNQDSDVTEEKFSPGMVKRRAEQYEVRRAMRNQSAEERKSYQELINSGIVKLKRKEHEELIEKDAMPPSPSDFRLDIEADQLERVVYQKERASSETSLEPSVTASKEASVVAPIVRQMEKEAVFESPPETSRSIERYRSTPKKRGSKAAPGEPAASSYSLSAASSYAGEMKQAGRTERSDRYPAQDDLFAVLPAEKPATETAKVTEEPQPISPRSVEAEAMLRYDRSQENRWFSVSGSDQEAITEARLLKTQKSEEQGKWLGSDSVGRSETLRYDRAQENLLPSADLGEATKVEQLKENDLNKETDVKIPVNSERFESKQFPPAPTSSTISGTSEDSSPSSAESDGGGDYDTGYEQQYELQEVLKKVKTKISNTPKGQHQSQKPAHESKLTNLSSLTEADNEKEFESEENSSSGGDSPGPNDDGVLDDQQLFFTGHSDTQPPISIVIADENAISSLLVQDDSSESASSESDDDEDYSETVRAAAEWYKSHPVEDMYLPRRQILATIDEETISQASTRTSIVSQSTEADTTVVSRQSDLINQDTILVRPQSPSNLASMETPVAVEEDDLSGSAASDSDKIAKPESTNISQEAQEETFIMGSPSSKSRSSARLPVSSQVAKVAQTDIQLLHEQESNVRTSQGQSSDNYVTVNEGSTLVNESPKPDQIKADPASEAGQSTANIDADDKKKTKKKKEHRKTKKRHRSKSPKPEGSHEKANLDFQEENFEKVSVQSQQNKVKVKAEERKSKGSSSAATVSEPPLNSNATNTELKPTQVPVTDNKSENTGQKEHDLNIWTFPKLQEEPQHEKNQRSADAQKHSQVKPTLELSPEPASDSTKKSEAPHPPKLIRSSFRSSSGRKLKSATEEKKPRPKSSSEDANVDQLVKTASNTNRASLKMSKPESPLDSNGDSTNETGAKSDHRSQKLEKAAKTTTRARQLEEKKVSVEPEFVPIEDNIGKLDINDIKSSYQAVRSSQDKDNEVVSQPQLWRSPDSCLPNEQVSAPMPELVAYAAPSYASKRSVSPLLAQPLETVQDLPCIDVSSLQVRPHRLSGSSPTPSRSSTPPVAQPAKQIEENNKQPISNNDDSNRPRRSKKEKPKVIHFSNRRKSPEPNKPEEETETNLDSELEDEGAPVDTRIDQWVENSNKHLTGDASRSTISGPTAAPRGLSRKPDYQRQETGGFAVSDADPTVPVVNKPSTDRLSLASRSESFDQESLVVASDLSEINEPADNNNDDDQLSKPAPTAQLEPDDSDQSSDSQTDKDDDEISDNQAELDDNVPVMRPLSWQPISIEHPPTGLGNSGLAATLPSKPPPSQPTSTTLPAKIGGPDSLNQGAIDFLLGCLSSKPILPPGDAQSADATPTRQRLLNPYQRQVLEQARKPQPPLVADPLPLDADERRRYERKREAIKANNSRRRSNRLGRGSTGGGGGGDGPAGSSRTASYYHSSSALSGRELSFTALSPAVMRRQSRRRSRSRSPETAGGRSKSFTGIGGAVSADALTGRGANGAKSDGEEDDPYDDDEFEDVDEDDDDQLRSATFDTRRREWTWFASNADFVGAANGVGVGGGGGGGGSVDPRLRSRSMPIPTSDDYNELAVQVGDATKSGGKRRRRRRRRLPPAGSNFVYETSV